MSYNSTILNKKKQLGCGCFDYNFSKNRCKMHATIEDTEKRAAKYAAQPTVRKSGWFDVDKVEEPKEVKGGGELQRWFEDRHKEMTGTCVNCGGKTQKGEANYKNSLAHILPKAYFKSVATHEDNWMELCFYGNSCHTNYDNKMIDILDLSCFDSVIQKFVRMYPHITKEERRRIPNVLLEYIETEI